MAVMHGKMKAVFDKAFSHVGTKDSLVNFGLAFETKKGKHVEAGFIDGEGYIIVNGEWIYDSRAKK